MTTETQLYNLRNPVEIIQSLNGLVRFRTPSGVMHTEPIDIFDRNYELVKVDGWRDIVDKQREALERIKNMVSSSYCTAAELEIIYDMTDEALALTATEKEHPILEELKAETEIMKKHEKH